MKRGDDIMQDLIKKIRSHMNMNQTEFAELLNVTFATVNRWENGRALPNKLAQDKIYDLCKEYDVPVYDMVFEKIEAASGSIELEKGRMLLISLRPDNIERYERMRAEEIIQEIEELDDRYYDSFPDFPDGTVPKEAPYDIIV